MGKYVSMSKYKLYFCNTFISICFILYTSGKFVKMVIKENLICVGELNPDLTL